MPFYFWIVGSVMVIGPGSLVVTDYLEKTGLLKELEKIGFYIVGYGVRPDLRKPFFDSAAASFPDRFDS